MTALTVHTQAELDAALTNPAYTYATHEIVIDSPAGVWIEIRDDHGQDVNAYGSSQVRAYESSQVRARDSSQVSSSSALLNTSSGFNTIF